MFSFRADQINKGLKKMPYTKIEGIVTWYTEGGDNSWYSTLDTCFDIPFDAHFHCLLVLGALSLPLLKMLSKDPILVKGFPDYV